MNFERHIGPATSSSLNIGSIFLKRKEIESFMEPLSARRKDIQLGLGKILEFILETKDLQVIEIFKKDFLQYFAIPQRKEEGWRWMVILKNLSDFSKKDQIKVRDLVIEIHDQISFS